MTQAIFPVCACIFASKHVHVRANAFLSYRDLIPLSFVDSLSSCFPISRGGKEVGGGRELSIVCT